ncbi:MAG: response regulator transcription factor [Bacteroidetes bacterium]|nr:response regulator transcription factor [Bacteroidota bacterium]
MNKPLTFFITDDHQIFRQGLRMALSDDPALECIGEAGNGKELLEQLKFIQPDVILLDLKMPEMDGMEATREVRKQFPDLRILILTMHDDDQLVLHLLEAGANGYLVKNTDADEIKLALHSCKDTGYYFSDYVSNLMLRSIIKKNAPAPTFRENVELSDREKEVLLLICDGCTMAEIGEKIFLSPRTVEKTKTSLYEKTGAKNSAGLIMYAVKQGFVS